MINDFLNTMGPYTDRLMVQMVNTIYHLKYVYFLYIHVLLLQKISKIIWMT